MNSDDDLNTVLEILPNLDKKQLKIVEIEARNLRQDLKLKEEQERVKFEISKTLQKWRSLSKDQPLFETYEKLSEDERWIFSQVEFVNRDVWCGEEPDIRCDSDYCKWKDSGGYEGGEYDGTGYIWFLDESFVICHVCLDKRLSKIEKILKPELIKICKTLGNEVYTGQSSID